jgi:hypothetical protein
VRVVGCCGVVPWRGEGGGGKVEGGRWRGEDGGVPWSRGDHRQIRFELSKITVIFDVTK